MSEWKPIESAPRENCKEFIGTMWAFNEDGKPVCLKEPFISFFSPSLNKFFASPTHWMPLPSPPREVKE